MSELDLEKIVNEVLGNAAAVIPTWRVQSIVARVLMTVALSPDVTPALLLYQARQLLDKVGFEDA